MNSIIGQLAIAIYMLFVIFVFINLFISIMIVAFREVNEKNRQVEKRCEIDGLDYIGQVIRRFLGIIDPPTMFDESDKYQLLPCMCCLRKYTLS